MSEIARIVGTEPISTQERYGQVYMATHKGKEYLPFMNRSFISFSFGSKKNSDGIEVPVNIEDFNLLATIDGNRMTRDGSAALEDLVDEYNILDGQFYWGTHFKPNKITFKLATDGITQAMLDEFLYWFAGGKTRELILSEHPNRAIMARVSQPPTLSLLPFQHDTTVMVGGTKYKTSTTLFKGEITLNLVMDMPFWYSKVNIFGHYNTETGEYEDTWLDANGNTISIFDSYQNLDVMKIILEDNIPTSTMIAVSMLLGNNVFASKNDIVDGKIAAYEQFVQFINNSDQENREIIVLIGYCDIFQRQNSTVIYNAGLGTPESPADPEFLTDSTESIDNANLLRIVEAVNGIKHETVITTESSISDIIDAISTIVSMPAEVDEESYNTDISSFNLTSAGLYRKQNFDNTSLIYDPATDIGAKIDGPHMANNTGVSSLDSNSCTYFYYAGTAYALPTIEFKMTPIIDGDSYVCSPNNSYASTLRDTQGKIVPYNTITFTSLTTREFKFTTPNIYTSYNEAIKIFKQAMNRVGDSWENIRLLIRDNVKHYAVRAWAIKVIDFYAYENKLITGEESLLELMEYFLKDNNNSIPKATYIFNSETGVSTGEFTYRKISDSASIEEEQTPTPIGENEEENEESESSSNTNDAAQFLSQGYSIVTTIEDVNDMIKSNYLIITDRNHPDTNGNIVNWSDESDWTKTYCHKLEHNVSNGLQNIFIKYKNMYL